MDLPDPRIAGKQRGLLPPGTTYPLGCHLADTAAIAGSLWDAFLTPAQRRLIADSWAVDAEHARTLLMLAAGLHDLGKSTPCCQYDQLQLPSLGEGFAHAADREPLPHAYASGITVPQLLTRLGWELDDAAVQLGQIVAGHHGNFPAMPPAFELEDPHDLDTRLGTGRWDTERTALTHLVHSLIGHPPPPRRAADVLPAALVAAVVVLADRLASPTRAGQWVRARLAEWRQDPHWQRHYQRAVSQAPNTVAAEGLTPAHWAPLRTFTDTFHVTPRPLQHDVAQQLPALAQGPGLLLIADMTGNGKTETAFYAGRLMAEATGSSGLAVLLPTRATAEAMYLRLRDFVRDQTTPAAPVTLVHGTAWLNTDYNPDHGTEGHGTYPTEWMRQRLLGLLATGGMAATWDQAALAALPTAHNAVRLLGLSNKTVIIDEAHSYDAYGQTITRALLALLGALRVPVILMSATLTTATATTLANAYLTGAGRPETNQLELPYPGWAYIDATTGMPHVSKALVNHERERSLLVTHQRVRYAHDPTVPTGRAAQLLAQLRPLTGHGDGTVMIVCNTVDDAQRTHRLLAPSLATGIGLLHARMPRWQRDHTTQLLQQQLGRHGHRQPGPFVLIATQIAEQSLDVDFDLVISDLAPIDYLIQRAGRCWRHHRPRPPWASSPRLHVLVPAGPLPPPHWGTKPGVYYGHLLQQTAAVLSRLSEGRLHEPGDVQHLIETVYANDSASGAGQDRITDEQLRTQLAGLATVPHPVDLQTLHDLSNAAGLNTRTAATRLGADGSLALPVWPDGDGRLRLHPALGANMCGCPDGDTLIPATINRGDRDMVRRILAHTVPLPTRTLDPTDPTTRPPDTWQDIGPLADLRLLPHTGTPASYRGQNGTLSLDPTLGIKRRQPAS
ncbi:CRISPR-associated helicase Cas3' [Streptomyces olivoreticuli]